MKSLLSRCARLTALLVSFALPASATWSIVIVDRRTGEIGVGCATCIGNFGIRRAVPVMVVGKGVAAAQATVDGSGVNRQLIFQMLSDGESADAILAALASSDSMHQGRQYGITSLGGGLATTFTGSNALAWAGGVTGESGDWIYAIQGNILTGPDVVNAAETALLTTGGDMSQRLLAAMLAARNEGGDSRCNCSPGCGVPPPMPFVSAYTSFMGIGRLGDIDGSCGSNGCAEGTYFLKRQVVGQFGDPDPVDVLAIRVANWRSQLAGRPDHLLSSAYSPTNDIAIADGSYAKLVEVHLVDVDGVPLTSGGATVTVQMGEGSVPFTTTPVVDHGTGLYTFDLVAGTLPGDARLEIRVDDGVSPITLAPYLELPLIPNGPLSHAPLQVSAANGSIVDFVISKPARAGSPYVLLGSASGTSPGLLLAGGVNLPLNPDGAFTCTLIEANGPLLPNSFGFLDTFGEARTSFRVPPDFLGAFAGGELSFAALVFQPFEATPAVTISVLP